MTDSEGNEIGKLFIGGLSQATNNASLRLYFSRFGEVDDAVVMMDNKTGRSRGFGYVKYREPEAVMLALEAKPHILDGKEVDAKQCNINMKGRNRRSLKIFVGGIGLDQDAESIKNFFRQFGRVTDVNLMMDSNKQRHRGFAFVGFEDESVVKRLISLHYVMMNTKQVEIKAMEPPNFGRKVGHNGCLTTAAIMNGTNPSDGFCGQTFENGTDCNNMLSAPFVSSIPYISAQSQTIPCLPNSIMTPTRAHPTGLYEQTSASYDTSLENIYQTATILQPINHTNKVFDPLQSAGAYVGSRQSLPIVVTGGPNQTSTLNQNSLAYTTFPYQIIPPTYIPSQQQPGVPGANQLVGAGKPASAWPAAALTPGPMTICPSHIPTANNLIPCPPYAPAHPSTLQNPQQSPILTPYYTLCPQYAAVPLQSEQAVTTAYTVPQASNLGSTNITQANGTTNSTIGGSRSPTPVNDSRVEQNKTNNLTYHAVMMPGPGGAQHSPMLAASGHVIGQNYWSQPHSNMVYSPVQVGWTVHTNSQGTIRHNWSYLNDASPQLQSNACFDAAITKPTNPISEETQRKGEENEVKQPNSDTVKSAQAKASGDGLDNVIPTNQEAKNAVHISNARVTSVDLLRIPETINSQLNKTAGETEMWSTSDNMLSPVSWTNNAGKWTDDNQARCNFNSSSETAIQPWDKKPVDDDQMGERTLGDFVYANSMRQTSIQSNTAQPIHGATGSFKADKSTGDSVGYRITQQKTAGHTVSNATHHQSSTFHLPSSRTGNNNQTVGDESTKTHNSNEMHGMDMYSDYTAWLIRKAAADVDQMDKNTVDRKELQSNRGVELECQGPAGAAGDFHRPMHTTQYNGYRVAR